MSVSLSLSFCCLLFSAYQTPVTNIVRLTDNTANNFKALQSELNSSNPGDTIELRLAPTANRQPAVAFSATLVVAHPVTIAFNPIAPPGFGHHVDNVVFDGGGRMRHFLVQPGGNLTLKSIKFTRGQAAGSGKAAMGGAILNEGTLTVMDCQFIKNDATFGGAIASLDAVLHLANGSFNNTNGFTNQMTSNQAMFGLGVYALAGTLVVAEGQPPNFGVSLNDTLALAPIRKQGQPTRWPDYIGIGNNFREVNFVNTLAVTSASGGNTPGSLHAVVAGAADGDLIAFSTSIKDITLQTPLIIDKNLTLVGPVTLHGARKSPLIKVTRGRLRLYSISLYDGYNDMGGGAIHNAGELHLLSCNLRWNHSNSSGGAVYNATNATLLSFSTLYFRNSAVGSGGAVYNDGTAYFGTLDHAIPNRLVYASPFRLHAYNGSGINPGTVSNNTAGAGGGIYSANQNLLGQLFLKAGSSLVPTYKADTRVYRYCDPFWNGRGGRFKGQGGTQFHYNGPDDLAGPFSPRQSQQVNVIRGIYSRTQSAAAPFTPIAFFKIDPQATLDVQFGTTNGGYTTYTYDPVRQQYVHAQQNATVSGNDVVFTGGAGNRLATYTRVRELVPQGNWTNIDNLSMDFQIYSVGCGERSPYATIDDPCDGFTDPCATATSQHRPQPRQGSGRHPAGALFAAANQLQADIARATKAAGTTTDPKVWGADNAQIGGLLTNDIVNKPDEYYYYRQDVTANPNNYRRPASGSTMTQFDENLIFHRQKKGTLRFYVRKDRLYGPSFKIDGAWRRLSGNTALAKLTVKQLTNGDITVDFGTGARTYRRDAYRLKYSDPQTGHSVTFLRNHVYYRDAKWKALASFGR